MAMKYLLLLGAAYVGGVLRHPHEGVIHVDEADAEQPLADKLAEDVTADFDALDTSDDAPQRIAANVVVEGGINLVALENPHQAEIMPDVAETPVADISTDTGTTEEPDRAEPVEDAATDSERSASSDDASQQADVNTTTEGPAAPAVSEPAPAPKPSRRKAAASKE